MRNGGKKSDAKWREELIDLPAHLSRPAHDYDIGNRQEMSTIAALPPWLASTPLSHIPILNGSSSLLIFIVLISLVYVLFEVGFFFHYHWHLVPNANRRHSSSSSSQCCRPPAPYRDYAKIEDRHKLLIRILDRIIDRGKPTRQQQQFCGTIVENDNNIMQRNSDVIYKFIEGWFEKKKQHDNASYQRFSEQIDMATLDVGLCPLPPPMVRTAWSSFRYGDNNSISVVHDDDEDDDEGTNQSSSTSLFLLDGGESPDIIEPSSTSVGKVMQYDRIQKGNMDEFLSWAFFGIPITSAQSSPQMQQALNSFYDILQTRAGLLFEPGYNANYQPRTFTFENVKSLYRPFCVYAMVALLRMAANCTLYIMGFRMHICRRGLRYWHRASIKQQRGSSPFLFFHGIAPGGHAPYLPMLFLGLLRGPLLSHRHRDIFIFENKPISYALCFDALSEEETVHGVLEALHKHLGTSSRANTLSLCGHSFGSCQLTWLIKCPEMKDRIQSLYLIDPVSILLSEPDVVVNFLYSRATCHNELPRRGITNRFIRFINETKIHLVASSELFIEHYLRRNFAWYNSELWLNDIPDDVKVVVALAECDEIVNAPKIERELDRHNFKVSMERTRCSSVFIEKIMWRDVGHAHCITNPTRWSDIHHIMTKIESDAVVDRMCSKVK